MATEQAYPFKDLHATILAPLGMRNDNLFKSRKSAACPRRKTFRVVHITALAVSVTVS